SNDSSSARRFSTLVSGEAEPLLERSEGNPSRFIPKALFRPGKSLSASTLNVRTCNRAASRDLAAGAAAGSANGFVACEKRTPYSSIEYSIGLSATLTIASSTSFNRTFRNGRLNLTTTLFMSIGSGGGTVIAWPVWGSITEAGADWVGCGLIRKLQSVLWGLGVRLSLSQ